MGCTYCALAHEVHSSARMGAIDNFFRRFGYAKLDRYGLMLTPDDRVLSRRPTVLDDGLGSKIVGWTDDDLAAMELDHWGAAKVAPAKPVAAPKSLHRAAPPAVPLAAKVIAPAFRLPGVAPMVAPIAAPIAAPVAAPMFAAPVAAPVAPAVAKAPVVAEAPEVEEDEWEWDIAMARARAAAEWAAEEVAQAAASIATSVTAPTRRKTSPGIPAVRAKTEPPVRTMPAAVAPIAKAPERKTIIPVPQLPTAARASDLLPYRPSAPPRRTPRGTGPIHEDTVQTLAAPPANDDTTPYLTLPSEVRPVGYAHTKRVAAKQR